MIAEEKWNIRTLSSKSLPFTNSGRNHLEQIISQAQGRVPVTIPRVRGEMNPVSANEMAMRAREILAADASYLLIKLTDVPALGWAGILATDSILEFLLAN